MDELLSKYVMQDSSRPHRIGTELNKAQQSGDYHISLCVSFCIQSDLHVLSSALSVHLFIILCKSLYVVCLLYVRGELYKRKGEIGVHLYMLPMAPCASVIRLYECGWVLLLYLPLQLSRLYLVVDGSCVLFLRVCLCLCVLYFCIWLSLVLSANFGLWFAVTRLCGKWIFFLCWVSRQSTSNQGFELSTQTCDAQCVSCTDVVRSGRMLVSCALFVARCVISLKFCTLLRSWGLSGFCSISSLCMALRQVSVCLILCHQTVCLLSMLCLYVSAIFMLCLCLMLCLSYMYVTTMLRW